MPKAKLTLSVDNGFKEDVRRLGEWYQQHGVDVEDKQHGGVSISKTLDALVADKLRNLKSERDPDQAYFWTPEWQAGEREADADIAAGRVKSFATMEDFLADLDSDNEE